MNNFDSLPQEVLIEGDVTTRDVYVNGEFLDPVPSQKVWNKSPDGFMWGYGGSGPAQLSLAILLKFMPEEQALLMFQDFKFKVVGAWTIDKDIDAIINLRQIVRQIDAEKILKKVI